MKGDREQEGDGRDEDEDEAEERYAFVTLITSDEYLPGALALAAALKEVHGKEGSRRGEEEEVSGAVRGRGEYEYEYEYETVCLVTPETVEVNTVRRLRQAYEHVIGVEVIAGDGEGEGLRLLGMCVIVLILILMLMLMAHRAT